MEAVCSFIPPKQYTHLLHYKVPSFRRQKYELSRPWKRPLSESEGNAMVIKLIC